jgi:Icc-related predicted phosphoesterase
VRAFCSVCLPVLLSACSTFAPEPAFRSTLPADIGAGRTRTIAVVGDLQMTPGFVRHFRGRENNRETQRALIDDLHAHMDELAAVVVVGDLVFTPRSGRNWAHLDSLLAPVASEVPVLPTMGNHDYHCLFVQLCWQSVIPKQMRMRFPWLAPGQPYAVNSGAIVLLFVDSETALESQAQWLADRLRESGPRQSAALVFFHRPPFSNSIDKGAVGDAAVQQWIVPVLQESPIPTVVVNGHIHGYEHLLVDGVRYVTSAGGGGPRGLLGPDRPNDVYAGRDCRVDPDGAILRPFNYLLIRDADMGITIEVRGFCGSDEPVDVLESITVAKHRGERARP